MGLFSSPSAPSAPPPPPPPPPAAAAPTYANGAVQAAGASARARAAAAAGMGFNGTDLTRADATGAGPTAKAQLTGQTA